MPANIVACGRLAPYALLHFASNLAETCGHLYVELSLIPRLECRFESVASLLRITKQHPRPGHVEHRIRHVSCTSNESAYSLRSYDCTGEEIGTHHIHYSYPSS